MEEVATRGSGVARRMVDGSRLARIALRETLFLALSLAGAVVFLNHQMLYFAGDGPSSLSWIAYPVSTVLIYGFVRGISLAGGMYVPRRAPDPTVCPECGRPYEDGTPHGASWVRDLAEEASASPRTKVTNPVPLARPIPIRTPSTPGRIVNPRLDFLLMQGLPARNAPPPESGGPTGSQGSGAAEGEASRESVVPARLPRAKRFARNSNE